MDIDERVGSALREICLPEAQVHFGLALPDITADGITASRDLCRQNICGSYGRSWTCPPRCGTPGECVSRASAFSRCAVIHRRFSYDPEDHDRTARLLHAFQEMCRSVKRALNQNGIRCLVLAGGPCTYCTECSAVTGGPCRFPEGQIPSVSVYAIDVPRLLEDSGIRVDQPEGTLTLFGVVLY